MLDAAYFLEKAEQCFRLSRTARLNADVAAELETMGYEFMAKAVDLDTARDKATKSG
jgi:hypothetical protein